MRSHLLSARLMCSIGYQDISSVPYYTLKTCHVKAVIHYSKTQKYHQSGVMVQKLKKNSALHLPDEESYLIPHFEHRYICIPIEEQQSIVKSCMIPAMTVLIHLFFPDASKFSGRTDKDNANLCLTPNYKKK